MGKLWIIRHGQASLGSNNYDALSTIGQQQAMVLGRHLSGCNTLFHSAFSGTQQRQIDTGNLILEAMPLMNSNRQIEKRDEFNEYDFMAIIHSQLPGLLEDEPGLKSHVDCMLTDHKSFQRVFSRIITRWVAGTHDISGVETFKEYTGRVRSGLLSILENSDRDVDLALFTSGGVISVAMQMALDLSDHETMVLGWQIKNASVTVLGHEGKRLYLETFNSVAHLEITANPELVTHR